MDNDPLLPGLRADLEFYPAPDKPEGAPEWMIRDPLHSTFERVSWQQMEILRQLGKPIKLSELQKHLQKNSTLRLSDQDIIGFCEDLSKRGLTTSSQHLPVELLKAREDAKQVKPLRWLLGHYLYFRIPLLHPDRFLERTLPFVTLLINRFTLPLLGVAFLTALYILSQNFDDYKNTFLYFFDWQGALAYSIALAGVKAIHEFSHAYCAKSLGNRVPTMGLAFIVMWPVPFCDVTDSWRMQSRRKRLLISSSGILTELSIAAFAVILWHLLPKGTARSILFILSSISLIGTVAVNLNPAMRFDGYYIFSDLLGVDNLQQRAFRFFLWSYRKKFLGIDAPCPEIHLSEQKHVILQIYAVYAVIYRFFLYLGIAALVYYAFNAKLLGILLFSVEILFFLIRPVYKELTALWTLREEIRPNLLRVTLWIALLGLTAWALLPLNRRAALPAISIPSLQQIVFAPDNGILENLNIQNGMPVKIGDPIAVVRQDLLNEGILLSRLQLQQVQEEIENLSTSGSGRELLKHKTEEKLQLQARLQGLINQQHRNRITAAMDGIVYGMPDGVRDGLSVAKGLEMGRIACPGDFTVTGYIPQSLVNAISTDQRAVFHPDDNSGEVQGKITVIHKARKEYLPYPALASINGGEIAIPQGGEKDFKIKDGYYEFTFIPDESNPQIRFEQPGKVWVETAPRSIFYEWITHAQSVLIRESGF